MPASEYYTHFAWNENEKENKNNLISLVCEQNNFEWQLFISIEKV